MSGPCFVCGRPHAPFGFGLPGLRSDKPEGKRGYLWACAEHRADGEERRRQATGSLFGRSPDQNPTPTSSQKGTQ